MLLPAISVASIVVAALLALRAWIVKREPFDSSGPQQMQGIRLRNNNKTDNVNFSGPNWVILILIGLTMAAFAVLALITFPF